MQKTQTQSEQTEKTLRRLAYLANHSTDSNEASRNLDEFLRLVNEDGAKMSIAIKNVDLASTRDQNGVPLIFSVVSRHNKIGAEVLQEANPKLLGIVNKDGQPLFNYIREIYNIRLERKPYQLRGSVGNNGQKK
jgi:hypothetical protein